MNFGDHPLTTALFDQIIGAWAEDLGEEGTREVLARAGELGLFAPIYRYLGHRKGRGVLDGGDRWRRHVARIAMLRHEVETLSRDIASLDPIFLKGDLLSEDLYGDRFLRETGDIDLLIHPQNLDVLLDRLRARGYRPEAGTRPMPWVANQYPVYHETTGVTIELHWAISYPYVPSPSIDTILAHHRRAVAGSDAHVLDREMAFLHLCYHFQQHSGFLKGLVDIAGWLDRYEGQADLSRIGSMARELGVYGMMQWPLHALDLLTRRRSALYDPQVDPIIKTWAAWTARCAQGALSARAPIADWASLAFKTQNMSSVHKMAWALAGMTTLDGFEAKISAMGWMIFRDPRAIAAADGKTTVTPQTYLKMAMRPGLLVQKQLAEWLEL